MKASNYFICLACGVVAAVFNIWWFVYAPCGFVLKVSWALKNVPMHCLYPADFKDLMFNGSFGQVIATSSIKYLAPLKTTKTIN